MTNLENYLYRKFKAYNDKQLMAMERRDFKAANIWQIKANTVFEVFSDISNQPLLRAKVKSEMPVVKENFVN